MNRKPSIIDHALKASWDLLITDKVDVVNIIRIPSIRKMYREKYDILVKSGKLQAIEEIPTENKRYYWDATQGFTEIISERIEAAKVVYTLDYLAEEVQRGRVDASGDKDANDRGRNGMAE